MTHIPQKQFIYPISFQDFINYQEQKSMEIKSYYNLHELHKIRKLKKVLEDTENKVHNRIRLFKKVSDQIHKKKEKQNHQKVRKEQIRSQQNPSYSPIEKQQHKYAQQHKYDKENNCQHSQPTQKRQKIHRHNNNYFRSTEEESQRFFNNQSVNQKLNVMLEQKKAQAHDVKLERQKHKSTLSALLVVLIEQMKTKQLRKKLQSAETIRKNRYRVKQIKNQYARERFEEARRMKQQKFREEIQQYDYLQSKIIKLQEEEKQALMQWKKAVEE